VSTIGYEWYGTTGRDEGQATWTVGDYTQAIDFPSFTHAHMAARLINEAYKAGHAMALRQVAARLENITNEVLAP